MQDPSTPDRNAPNRRRLGRGLNALLGDTAHHESDAAGTELKQVHVDDLSRNPFQPRTENDPAAHEELVGSVRQHGVLQPLLVRPFGSGYQLIAGERRWLAAKAAGLERVPCRVLELDDRRVCEVALEENLKRKDLSVLEKAQAFQNYLNLFQTSIEDLARQVSLDRSTVSNMLRLLELAEDVKQALREEKISMGHARTLLSLNHEQQLEVCRRIQSESLSVREAEAIVRALVSLDEPVSFPDVEFPDPDAVLQKIGTESNLEVSNHVRALADQLRDSLGAKVDIRLRSKDSGTILIHFASNDDFERILNHLRHAA